MKRKIAVIFDLDGTLVDTEKIHAEAESKLLSKLGIKITPQKITQKYAGVSTESYIEKIAKYKKSLGDLMSEKNQIINDIVEKNGIYPIVGMPDFIKYLNLFKIPIFIASSSGTEWIKKCLDVTFEVNNKLFSYGDYFNNNFISSLEVKNVKPSPDIFLEAKKRMLKKYSITKDVNIDWIVIGDSLADGNGGINAGMKAFIFGRFEKEFRKNNEIIIFSTPQKLIKYIKGLLKT
jgi:beta-phosphoglucomutase-like phosphatase (HAD superfamily)